MTGVTASPTAEDWCEHGDVLALIVQARTGYVIDRRSARQRLARRDDALIEDIWRLVKTDGLGPRERAARTLDRLREIGRLR